MSEKDIKTIVLERCKEVGIKSSNRGLIAGNILYLTLFLFFGAITAYRRVFAFSIIRFIRSVFLTTFFLFDILGTGMDVATVCSVLAALGAIEAAAPPDSKAEPDLSLLASTAHPSLNTTTSTVNTSPETITGPGSVLYGVLSERWQSRLSEYIEDALKSKAASLLNDTTNAATDGAVVTSGVKTEGSTSNTSSAVAGANSNRPVPVSGINSTTATGANLNAKSTAPSVPPYNPLGSGPSSAATSAGVTPSTSCNNIAGTYLTSTLPSPNSTTQNSSVVASPLPNATSMSNTARLIAEYNSRNGLDPVAATSHTYTMPSNAVSTASNPAQPSYSAPLSAPIAGAPLNTVNPVVSYNQPVTNTAANSVTANSTGTSAPSLGASGPAPVLNNVANGPGLNSANAVGYRAPLGPDTTTTTNGVYNLLPNPTYPVLNNTTTSIPPSYVNTSYANTSTLNTSVVGTNNNNLASTVKPYTVPHSNPATTPATVGFLSVTNPTNKLVLPYMSSDGTLSKSASSNSISNGMSGAGAVPSLNNNVGFGLNRCATSSLHTLNTTTNPSYMTNSSTYNTMNSAVPASNISSIGNSASLGYQPPGPPYLTTAPMMGYNNNSSMPLNTAPYSNNNAMYPVNTANYGASFVTNTTNPALYQPATATNYANNTSTNSTNANTKTKVKTPKPPAEKKLTKKAAAAASKLDSTNISRVNSAQGNIVGGSASSSLNGTVTSGTTGVNSNKARRGPSALRVWKLREEYVQLDLSIPSLTTDRASSASSSINKTTNAALALLLDPSLLGTAASIHYAMHSALETEERLLRRIAGLCNFNLKPNRYRLGTAMLSSDPDIMNRTSTTSSRLYGGGATSAYTTNSSNAVSTTKATTKYTDTSSTEEFYSEPTYAVYDDTTPITATYLLDKIRRTKRQRGDVLYGNISLPYTATTASVSAARNAAAASVGVYSAPHVHALAAVVSKTADYFWANTSNGKNKSKKAVAAVVNPNKAEPITMAQYARNVHTGVGGNNIVLSSCSNGASITNHTLRRYAQPIELYNAHLPCDVSKLNAFAAATGGHHNTNHSTSAAATNNGTTVLSIPDLTLNTREIAWTSIAAEFAILPAPTEEGSIGFGYSASTAAIDTVSGYVDSTTTTVGNSSVKKRKYLNNDSVKSSKAGAPASSSKSNTSCVESNNTTASTLAMEVLAPQFTEIVPVTVIVEKMKVCVDLYFVYFLCK